MTAVAKDPEPQDQALRKRPAEQRILEDEIRPRDANLAQALEFLMARSTSVHTRRAMAIDARDFLDWLGKRSFLKVTDTDIERYQNHIVEEQGLAVATANRRMSTVRGLYKRAKKLHLVDESPAEDVSTISTGADGTTKALSAAEVERLLDACDLTDLRDLRDYLVLRVGFTTGLRVAALSSARSKNLIEDSGHHVLRVVEKRRKVVAAVILPHLREEISRFQRLTGMTRPDDPLFPTMWKAKTGWRLSHRPVSADTVTRALKRHTRAAGLSAITPHVMRATYITLARQAGADLADVQYSVGHSDPKTTLRYDRSKGALDRRAGLSAAAAGARRAP